MAESIKSRFKTIKTINIIFIIIFTLIILSAWGLSFLLFNINDYRVIVNSSVISFICLMIIISLSNNIKVSKKRHCRECGAKYNYNKDVAYDVTNIEVKKRAQYARIDFECYCPKCGTVTSFGKKIKTAKVDKDGNIKEINIRKKSYSYFK